MLRTDWSIENRWSTHLIPLLDACVCLWFWLSPTVWSGLSTISIFFSRPLMSPPLGRGTLWPIGCYAASVIPDGSPQRAGSASHTAAVTSERFTGPIILITGARDVTDYAGTHKGRQQSLPPEIINKVCWRLYCGCLVVGISVQNAPIRCEPCERREKMWGKELRFKWKGFIVII